MDELLILAVSAKPVLHSTPQYYKIFKKEGCLEAIYIGYIYIYTHTYNRKRIEKASVRGSSQHIDQI